MALVLALPAPIALAASTWPVGNCNDNGTGSLRAVIGAGTTLSGDTIDMTGLSCSMISLHTGAITVTQSSLTLNGPGQGKLTITGNYNGTTENDRIFNHTGTGGTLAINNLAMTFGNLAPTNASAFGGCIRSAGSVSLYKVGMYFCNASVTGSHAAAGGAVFASGSVSAKYSTFALNAASGGSSGISYGGAVFASSGFTAKYSTLTANSATGGASQPSFGGAAVSQGNLFLRGTTVSSNSAATVAGIEAFTNNTASITTTIKNSTISGNSAGDMIGGLYTNSGKVYLDNTTIAFNSAVHGRTGSSYPFAYFAPGVAIGDNSGPVAVTMQSTLIANNTYGNTEYDLSVPKRASTTVTFSGANNLVRATLAAVPSGTIKLACPLLGPLRFNGGPTQTHALLSHSPGIDQGNNSITLNWDQRGSPYARVSGSAADIGAYEVQQADVIFNNGFDGCPILF
ncbi:MAG: hypothetical protein JSR27_00140 [Proteobacteria bacterium]|nr:hypothetical protein [Pseudomonadota bacterium]